MTPNVVVDAHIDTPRGVRRTIIKFSTNRRKNPQNRHPHTLFRHGAVDLRTIFV